MLPLLSEGMGFATFVTTAALSHINNLQQESVVELEQSTE